MPKFLMINGRLLLLVAVFAVPAMQGQAVKINFAAMVAAGRVNGDTYENRVLGLTLTAPRAHWEVRGPISSATRQGRLIDAAYDTGVPERGPHENYTIGLLVEAQSNFSKEVVLEQYVRGLRARVEDEKVRIYKDAFPLTVRNVAYVGTIFRVYEKPNFGYFRGLYSTSLNGYFVTIELQCGEQERLEKLLSSIVQISVKPKP